MSGEQWNSYEFIRPPEVLCQFMNQRGEIFVAKPSNLHPEFNVAGLKWRLTGIARTYLDSLAPEVRAQIESTSTALYGNILGGAIFQGIGANLGL